MKTDNYIGVEVAKFLKENGCKIESEYEFRERVVSGTRCYQLLKKDIPRELKYTALSNAHHYHDIIVTHAKEFFGEALVGEDEKLWCTRVWEAWSYNTMTEEDFEEVEIPAYEYFTNHIKELLQEGRQKEADEYIMKHTIFNPKNK